MIFDSVVCSATPWASCASMETKGKKQMKAGLVILVPGTESAAEVTFSGLKPLLERDYKVLTFDFESADGQGPEQHFQGYTEQLSSLIDQHRDESIHLLGYSLGAHIALNVAAQNEHVASLCLVSGWLRTDSFQRERHDLWLRLYEQDPDLAGRLSHLVQYSSTYRAFLAEQQTAVQLTQAMPNEETRRRVEVNRLLDNTEAAKRVEIPTLLISGSSDFKVPKGHTAELYGALRNSTLVQTTGGHALLRERLGQVYGSYHDFLQGKLQAEEVISTLVP